MQIIINRLFLGSILISSIGIFAGLLDTFGWARSDSIDININFPWLPFENETRCYDELGCLNITRSWYHLVYRPLNIFPLPRSVIDTKFILYTRKNPIEVFVIDFQFRHTLLSGSKQFDNGYLLKGQLLKPKNDSSIRKSFFDAKKPTKFIIHGFIDTSLAGWISEMRDELLLNADMNIIVVDWGGGSLPLYTQATANTRLVALELAYLINQLIKNYKLERSNIHLIGHSLGAHTAGYTGALVPGLGRISGLDPAEPYFQGMGSHVRLDPSDADLVDVIHTNGKGIIFLGYGMSQPCGDLDFYPNNGKEQPGCEITQSPLIPLTLIREGIEEASRELVACNHVRAIKFYIDSINSQCPYIAHQCSDYTNYMSGGCFDCRQAPGSCVLMGYHADSVFGINSNDVYSHDSWRNKFFIATGKDFPYCHYQYKITVELARPVVAEKWVQGFLKLSVYADAGAIYNLDITPKGALKLEHGTSYTILATHPIDLNEDIYGAELNWEYDMNLLEPRSICLTVLWCNDHLYVKSIMIEQAKLPERRQREIRTRGRFCPQGNVEYADLSHKSRFVFSAKDCTKYVKKARKFISKSIS